MERERDPGVQHGLRHADDDDRGRRALQREQYPAHRDADRGRDDLPFALQPSRLSGCSGTSSQASSAPAETVGTIGEGDRADEQQGEGYRPGHAEQAYRRRGEDAGAEQAGRDTAGEQQIVDLEHTAERRCPVCVPAHRVRAPHRHQPSEICRSRGDFLLIGCPAWTLAHVLPAAQR
jgi:hypothetical protein